MATVWFVSLPIHFIGKIMFSIYLKITAKCTHQLWNASQTGITSLFNKFSYFPADKLYYRWPIIRLCTTKTMTFGKFCARGSIIQLEFLVYQYPEKMPIDRTAQSKSCFISETSPETKLIVPNKLLHRYLAIFQSAIIIIFN